MPEPVRIRLGAEYQRLADPQLVPQAIRQVIPQPLQHQLGTVEALTQNDLVINAFPTGTGKTKAALLWLLERAQANTLFIAPVNELVRQQARDAKQFIENAGLPHVVAAVDAAYLRGPALEHLPRRPGERFYRILTNPSFLPEMQTPPHGQKPPLFLVTNPDLFYYAVFYLFHHLDRRNLGEQFIGKFDYIVIDEVHYYNAKQLANFLFFILLSKTFGYFDSAGHKQRKICLLTATPDSELKVFFDRLDEVGIRVHQLIPDTTPADDPLATKSLAELDLELYPYTQDAAGEFSPHVERIAGLVEQGKDGAILLNSLYGVNRLARTFESRLGVQRVGRITGPLGKEERKQAPFKPLLLATPTVDIGFNFEGQPKNRQNLDFVGFEAALEDQFWQRLGRGGRVLGKQVQDVPSLGLAFIPDGPWHRLHEDIGTDTALSRAAFKKVLHGAANGEMRRPSFAEYVSSYALLEVTQPLAEMERLLGERGDIIQRAFDTIKRVYAPSSKKYLWSLKGEIRRLQDFRRLQQELRQADMTPHTGVIRALREYAQEDGGQVVAEEDVKGMAAQILSDDQKREQLRAYITREVAALQPIFSFRNSDIGIEIEADDPHGLVSPARETVHLTLFHLLRFYRWKLKEEPRTEKSDLKVILQEIVERPLQVSWTFGFDGSWENFQRRYTKKPTALRGLRLSLHQQDSIVPVPGRIAEAVSERHVPCLILSRDDLKPWQWGSLIRDGIHSTELEISFAEGNSPSRKLCLLDGTDGYKVMGRYGWSLQRKTGEWWIA